MANESIFSKVPVQVPNRSGFDLSHEHLTTLEVGTLVPTMCKELMPNTTFTLGDLASVSLPPFATDFNGKIELRTECFFIPAAQVFLGFKDFIAGHNIYEQDGPFPTSVPVYYVDATRKTELAGDVASLEDYLGYAAFPETSGSNPVSAMSMLCYHWVYQHWYRDSRIQNAPFVPSDIAAVSGENKSLTCLPWSRRAGSSYTVPFKLHSTDKLHDGVRICDLRQRNYDRDYFTTAQLTATAGSVLDVSVDVDLDAGEGTFTISSLRAQNTLQRFDEVIGRIGNHYGDYINAFYGKYPSSEVCSRPIYLGSSRQVLYSAGIDNTVNGSVITASGIKNPYAGALGGSGGQVGAIQSSSLVDKFTTDEFGYVMVIQSIVPLPTYGSLTLRENKHNLRGEFANAMFAGIGNQPIYQWEIDSSVSPGSLTPFGWTDRFAEYKTMHSRVSGSFRDGKTLSAFALKRSFTGGTELNSSFLQIPKNALADVLSFYDASKPAYSMARLNVGFQFKIVQPLPSYSIPSLEDPRDTHTEMHSKAGTHI